MLTSLSSQIVEKGIKIWVKLDINIPIYLLSLLLLNRVIGKIVQQILLPNDLLSGNSKCYVFLSKQYRNFISLLRNS